MTNTKDDIKTQQHPKTEKQAILLLWYVTNASASAYWKLYKHCTNALKAMQASEDTWKKLNIHKSHIQRLQEYKAQGYPQGYIECLQQVRHGTYTIVFCNDIHYPKQLSQLCDKPPLLFVKGNASILSQAQIAMVGTRKPSQTAQKIAFDFAKNLANEGLWITSGLAEGIDAFSHQGALAQGMGRTIAVLGTGIEECYPKKNRAIYDAIISQGGAVISEFLPHTKPLAHNFPRRNRIVSGLSMATLVVEAAKKSGSLITADCAAEQGKLVFAVPGHIYNVQAQGCHQLIREGGILIDSVEHIIEDINLPRRIHADSLENVESFDDCNDASKSTQLTKPAKVATTSTHQHSKETQKLSTQDLQDNKAHHAISDSEVTNLDYLSDELNQLLHKLDWAGQDMDSIVKISGHNVATLNSMLMELELHGLIVQTGGLYLRCRQ